MKFANWPKSPVGFFAGAFKGDSPRAFSYREGAVVYAKSQLKIDELFYIASAHDPKPKILAMIDAYLDESGIHDGAAICVVAGYFGGRGQWRKFEIDWRNVLKKAVVPLEKFHAKNVVKRQGFFADWNDEKHSEFLSELSRVIVSYKIYPVSQAVIVADFNALSLGERRACTGATVKEDGTLIGSGCPTKPYFVPFQYALRNICGYASRGGKAHFFFGADRGSFSGYALELFSYIKESVAMPNKDRLGDPAFPLAKETPQLQAADYFSYLTYLHGKERLSTGDWVTPATKPLNDVAQRARDRTSDFVFFDSECLRKMLSRELTPEAYANLSKITSPVTSS